MEVRYFLDNAEKIIWIIAISAAFVGITTTASAEFYEDTVTFVKPENSTVSQRGCYWDEPESNGLDYKCQWHIQTDSPDEFLEQLEDLFDEIVEQIKEEQGIDLTIPDVEPEVELTPTQEELVFFEQMKEDLEKKCSVRCTSSEERLLEILEDPMTFCYDGDRTSIQIQSPGATIDPTIEFTVEDNFKFSGNYWLGELSLNREKCRADDVLDNEVHTVWHEHKGLVNPFQKGTTIPEWRNALTLEYGIEYPELNEHNFIESQEDAKNRLCSDGLYGQNLKDQQNCVKVLGVDAEDPDTDTLQKDVNPMIDTTKNPVAIAALKYHNSGGLIAEIPAWKKTTIASGSNYDVNEFAQHYGLDPETLAAFMEAMK